VWKSYVRQKQAKAEIGLSGCCLLNLRLCASGMVEEEARDMMSLVAWMSCDRVWVAFGV